MTDLQIIYCLNATIIMFLVTFFLRSFSFVAFGIKQPPSIVLYIGQVISPAIIASLIVYCFRNTVVITRPYAIPELVATAVCVGLHLWKRNPLLSIVVSTAVYMVIIQKLSLAIM